MTPDQQNQLFGQPTALIVDGIARSGGPQAYITGLLTAIDSYLEICREAGKADTDYLRKAINAAKWVADTRLLPLPANLVSEASLVPRGRHLDDVLLDETGLPLRHAMEHDGSPSAVRAFVFRMSNLQDSLGPHLFGDAATLRQGLRECAALIEQGTLSPWPDNAPPESVPGERASAQLRCCVAEVALGWVRVAPAYRSMAAREAVALLDAGLDQVRLKAFAREGSEVDTGELDRALERAGEMAMAIKGEAHAAWGAARQSARTAEAERHQNTIRLASAIESRSKEYRAALAGKPWIEVQMVQMRAGDDQYAPVLHTDRGAFLFTNGGELEGSAVSKATAWNMAGGLAERVLGRGGHEPSADYLDRRCWQQIDTNHGVEAERVSWREMHDERPAARSQSTSVAALG